MNTLRGLTAKFLLLTVPMGIGCRQAEVLPNSGGLAVSELDVDKPKLIIKTPPVFFKTNDEGIIICGCLNQDGIKSALKDSGIKECDLEHFANYIPVKFNYFSNLLKNNPVQLYELQYIKNSDLSGVDLEIVSGSDFDLGMGFPGEVNFDNLKVTVVKDSFVLTPAGVYFRYNKNNEDGVREGLITTKFGRLLIIQHNNGETIVIDTSKGFIVKEPPKEEPPRRDDPEYTRSLFYSKNLVA